jgi:hypothetical protein
MKAAIRSAVLPLSALLLSGCADLFQRSAWEYAETESAIDGKVVSAKREFAPDKNPTLMRVSVTCKVKSGQLTVAVESYEKNTNGDTHPPSKFVMSDDEFVGKVAFTDLKGARTTADASEVLTTPTYNNMAVWEVGITAAQAMVTTNSDAFVNWAATVMPRSAFGAQDAGSVRLRLATMSGWAWGASFALGQEVATRAAALAVASEFFGYARDKQDLKGLASGQFFKRMLPVTVQLSNTGGQSEFTIPADDPVIAKVVDQCDGTEWWSAEEPTAVSEPEAGAPAAQVVSLEEDAPASAATGSGVIVADVKITKALDALFKQCGPSWEDLAPLATGERIQLPYRDLTISGITMADDDESSVVQVFFDDRENIAEISSLRELWGEDNVSQGARETFLDDRSFRSRADGMTFLNTMRWVRLRYLNPSGDLGAWADEAKEFPARPKSAVQVIECVMKRQ